MNAGIKLAACLVCLPGPLGAQGIPDQFSYEGMRFSGVGVEAGMVASTSLTTEAVGGVRVDYGVIAPRVRVVLGAAYFKGAFGEEKIAEFEEQLAAVVNDPTDDFTIDVGQVSLWDFEAFVDLQYLFGAVGIINPYVGLGLSAHLRDGDGAAIAGTFVEDALDTVAAGLSASVGLDLAVLRHVSVLLEVRGGLTSELRTLSARGGLMYRIP